MNEETIKSIKNQMQKSYTELVGKKLTKEAILNQKQELGKIIDELLTVKK